MTNITDVLHVNELNHMIAEKRIQKQIHPTLPLVIYNYTNRAQFAGEWTQAERVCRGLIVGPGGAVIARGPEKFFNYGQPGAPEVALDDWVRITRKEDGSLGIGWEYLGHYGVATRGSFASDQAIHASALLTADDKANIDWAKDRDYSRIWEIVYPENRIVLNYGNRDELIPLGTVGNESGLILYRPRTVVHPLLELTFADALKLPIPDDEEGYVLDILTDTGIPPVSGHIKLKGDRYKELHGAIFGLSERKIWEAMGRGDDMDEFVASLPDELMPWAQGVVDRIKREETELYASVGAAMGDVKFRLKLKGWGTDVYALQMSEIPRGEIARLIVEHHKDLAGPLFSYLDNKIDAVQEWAHKQTRPEHKLFRVESEDTN